MISIVNIRVIGPETFQEVSYSDEGCKTKLDLYGDNKLPPGGLHSDSDVYRCLGCLIVIALCVLTQLHVYKHVLRVSTNIIDFFISDNCFTRYIILNY